MRKLFVTLFFLGIFYVSGQQKSQFSGQSFSADLNLGYNTARYYSNFFFEQQMPYSFQLNWHKANYYNQNDLNHFGYSDFGVTFLYHDFRNEILGKNYGLYAFMEYYLIKPTKGFQWSFRLSQGTNCVCL